MKKDASKYNDPEKISIVIIKNLKFKLNPTDILFDGQLVELF